MTIYIYVKYICNCIYIYVMKYICIYIDIDTDSWVYRPFRLVGLRAVLRFQLGGFSFKYQVCFSVL